MISPRGRGVPAFIYRLTISLAHENFSLALPSDRLSIIPGEQAKIDVLLRRQGEFKNEVALRIEGLPEGVTVQGDRIPAGKNQATLTFTAADDARPSDVRLRIVGEAVVGGKSVRRTASAPHAGQDVEGFSVGAATVDGLFMTVRHKPVFRLFCSEAYLYANRGMVFPYRMEIERLDGFAGDVILQIGDRQNRDLDGIEMIQNVVPGDAATTFMPIYLPETMHANVQSQSQLYVQGYARFKDRWGDEQSLLVVSEKRCMLRSLPTVVKLKAPQGPMQIVPGGGGVCRLQLQRTTNFRDSMEIELVGDARRLGFTAPRVTIQPGQTEVDIPVRMAADIEPRDEWELKFRATGAYPGHVRVISEAVCPVRLAPARSE